MSENRPKYSVVVPVYNEEKGLEGLIARLEKTLGGLGAPYELVFVDDGSADRTWEILSRLGADRPHLKAYSFSRNFGHQISVAAGLHHARGEAVAVMDGDGQDPPEILPEMFAAWQRGHDVVYAVRRARKESMLKRAGYKLFYRLLMRVVPFQVPLDSGDFSVMDRKVVDFIVSSLEHNPFIRGLRSWYGGKQTGIEYDRPSRSAGESKYSLLDLTLLAVNGLTSFSKVPLRLAVLVGLLFSLIGIGFAVYSIAFKLIWGIPIVGYTSIVTLVAFLGGVQLIFMGLLAEYIGNIFDEVKGRPLFIVKKRLNA